MSVDQLAEAGHGEMVSPAGQGPLVGVLSAFATLTLAGAAMTGRAWWRGESQGSAR